MIDDNQSWHSSDPVGGFSGPADADQDSVPDSLEVNPAETPEIPNDHGNLETDAEHDSALELEFDREEGDGPSEERQNPSDWWGDDSSSEEGDNILPGFAGRMVEEETTDDSSSELSDLNLNLEEPPASDTVSPEPRSAIDEIWEIAGYLKELVFPEDNFAELDSALKNEQGLDELSKVIHGTPDEDLALWKEQESPMSCAVASTEMLLKSIGVDAKESELAEVFEEYGIYDPATGTDPHMIDEVVNKMAETEGLDIRAEEINNFTVDDLTKMLDAGNRPLICLDSAELYPDSIGLDQQGMEKMLELMDKPLSGHAVQLTGIIQTEQGTMVVLNDPGRPDGGAIQVPLDKFMAASDDFGWTAITITRA